MAKTKYKVSFTVEVSDHGEIERLALAKARSLGFLALIEDRAKDMVAMTRGNPDYTRTIAKTESFLTTLVGPQSSSVKADNIAVEYIPSKKRTIRAAS